MYKNIHKTFAVRNVISSKGLVVYDTKTMSELNSFQRWWVNAWPHRWRLRRHIPRFLRNCPEPFRGEVLEIGAGRGWTSRRILETFPQVELTATDVDQDATKTFTRLQTDYGRRLKVKEANVYKLPFDRGSFDIVLAIGVLPYLRPYAVRKALQEILRVVRPGGLIGLCDYTILPITRSLSRQSVEAILREEGCTISYGKGGSRYDIWAQKQYPVQPNA